MIMASSARKPKIGKETSGGPICREENIRLNESAAIGALEDELIRIWESVLETGPIGLKDNYFDLGGESLQASRIFAQIKKSLGVTLPLAAIFDASTIEDLARLIREQQDFGESTPRSAWKCLVPIQPSGSRPPFYCVHGAGGNVLLYQSLSRCLGPSQPFYGLQSQGLDGAQPLLTSIEEMAERYLSEITSFQPRGPYLLGGYCMGGTVALEMAQQLQRKGHEVALVAQLDTCDWSTLHPPTVFDKAYLHWQQILFHYRNFRLLGRGAQFKFLDEKFKVLKSRAVIWAGLPFVRLGKREGRMSTSTLPARLWDANEQAALRYVPARYDGLVVRFRPMRQYARYRICDKRQHPQVEGLFHEVVLHVYPGGMLVEPFVRETASKLSHYFASSVRAMAS
jgi:phthiocerol/phenolphthiocerol synthesis type-I polyketide synthase E